MLVSANTPHLRDTAAQILYNEIGVKATQDFQAIMWANKDTSQVEWVIGFDGFIGRVCQIHDVNLTGKSLPRELLRAAFHFPFKQCGIETLIGIVNSKNTRAMEFDRKLGFTEMNRLVGMHDDGGDIVMFKMARQDCRWIKDKDHANVLLA